MRILGLMTLIVMLGAAAVPAQKKTPILRTGPAATDYTNVLIQDDQGGGYISFNPTSGVYKCILCEYDYVLHGVGQVKVDGCNVYFSDIQEGYRVFASANMCDRQAKVACEVFRTDVEIEPLLEYWADSDMMNNVPDCSITTDCAFNIYPLFLSHPATGGVGTINVMAEDRCMWHAASDASWVSITSANAGVGAGVATYSVAPNKGVSRAGTITIGGNTFTVKQKGS
jgi:all-beta uncharacterized protein